MHIVYNSHDGYVAVAFLFNIGSHSDQKYFIYSAEQFNLFKS